MSLKVALNYVLNMLEFILKSKYIGDPKNALNKIILNFMTICIFNADTLIYILYHGDEFLLSI